MNKVLAVIPVRLGSTRLARKPLAEIAGKTMVQHVWESCQKSEQISRCVVATDSEEIVENLKSFSADYVMTSSDIPSGSARVAATLKELGDDWDIVLNVQGDMPSINSKLIDESVLFFKENYERFSMTTVAAPIYEEEDYLNPSKVKVVLGDNNQALYFSRSPIPHSRDGHKLKDSSGRELYSHRHIGLYLYKPEMLSVFEEGESTLEEIERLEQLRVLERGISIGVKVVDQGLLEGLVEVDTAEDLAKVRELVS